MEYGLTAEIAQWKGPVSIQVRSSKGSQESKFENHQHVRRGMCVRAHVRALSHSAIPWTVARQAPLSVEFFRQKYWSGLPFPSPGDLPNAGIEPASPVYIYTHIKDPITIYYKSDALGLDYLGKYVDWLKKEKG